MPIDRNKGKQSMFDLVPFAGRRRIMHNGQCQLLFISQFLEFLLPEGIVNLATIAEVITADSG